MKLKEIEIIEFKSIKDEKIDLTTNQICFVGINESGKTSILEATSYLNILEKTMTAGLLNKNSSRYPNGFPIICGLFEVSVSELSELSSWFSNDFGFTLELPALTSYFIYLKRWGNGLDNLQISLSNLTDFNIDLTETFKKQKSIFLDKFFNDFYPFIEIYKNEDLLLEPATIDELKGTEKKFETFRRLLHIGECYDLDIFADEDTNRITTYLHNIDLKLNAIFKRHYRQDDSITIHLTGFKNKLAVVIQDSTNSGFSISERSPGFQYYFAFLVNKLYLNSIHEKRNVIYLLDEPGTNLHPRGAKDLLRTFDEVSSKNQILYTTHNPFLAIRNNIDSLIFVGKNSLTGTKINRKPFLNKYQLLRKELGILLNDSFIIGDINIIVEGNTEKYALHRLFQEDNFTELEWVNIYNADGVSNISQALSYLGKNNLNLSGLVLLDSDAQAKNEQQKKAFIAAMKEKNWQAVEINDVFSKEKNERTFEDLFPQELYVGAFNEYCNSLKDLSVFSKEYKAYQYTGEIKTPIIRVLEEYFFDFIAPEKRIQSSITKQDIIRLLLDKTEEMEKEERKKVLTNVFKIINLIKEEVKKIIQNA